ncbi:MAG: hypothetical protein HQM03_13000 [Magnetococcales bacterium]|nr:hypothetical protein [Magnetococcales bacterium]
MLNFDPNLPRAHERLFNEGASSLLIIELEDRFGELPEALRKKVHFADWPSLQRWGRRFLHFNSLEEVLGE